MIDALDERLTGANPVPQDSLGDLRPDAAAALIGNIEPASAAAAIGSRISFMLRPPG